MSSTLHPDGWLHPGDTLCNESGNDSVYAVITRSPMGRRQFMATAAGAVVLPAAFPGVAGEMSMTPQADTGRDGNQANIRFKPVAPNTAPMADKVSVPAGYTARVLIAWGDSITPAKGWDGVRPMDEATQLHSFGAHTDGMHYFPFARGLAGTGGLLAVNSEYVDPALCNGIEPASRYASVALSLPMVRAQQAAHGVNILRVGRQTGEFRVQRLSRYNRRITANTPCLISGPAAGHALMQTSDDPLGKTVLGTLANCAHGHTPWGTYLTCEENFNTYFGARTRDAASGFDLTQHEKRYGIRTGGYGYRWHEVDERFDLTKNRNEPNRFGWVVEIDPFDPASTPVKRTALGRFKHESAAVVVDSANNVAVYMGDDERNEYVYKFVCSAKFKRRNQAANRHLLDSGTLYVARFDADGKGVWLPLVHGRNGLTPENGFADQGEVLIKCRQAADRAGATMMDRPEWIAVHPERPQCYVSLTNNSRRGDAKATRNQVDGSTQAGAARPPVDAANPRPNNHYGHILRWTDDGENVTSTTFRWDIFVRCGDPGIDKTLDSVYSPVGHDDYQGNIKGDLYGAPDGLWFDKDGRLWIQTDQRGDARGRWANIGGNAMLCADPQTGETRRFLTAPPYAEVTGLVTTPDGKTMFVGIQHPGEDWEERYTQHSSWPDNGNNGATSLSGQAAVRPRSSVVVITRDDGGVIGT